MVVRGGTSSEIKDQVCSTRVSRFLQGQCLCSPKIRRVRELGRLTGQLTSTLKAIARPEAETRTTFEAGTYRLGA